MRLSKLIFFLYCVEPETIPTRFKIYILPASVNPQTLWESHQIQYIIYHKGATTNISLWSEKKCLHNSYQ